MYSLKNWKVEAHHGKMIVWGEVYGHDKYPDGMSLHTSMIQEIDMDERHVLFSTRNSVYRCAFSTHAISVRDVSSFDQLPEELFACDRTLLKKKIIDAVSAGLNAVANGLQSFMKDVSGDYTLILFDTDADYYFRWMLQLRDGKKFLVPQNGISIREGTVQDSVLVGNGVKGQVMKYFPFTDDRLTFYEWENSWEPVYFLNGGKKNLQVECSYGSFVLKPGERICPSDLAAKAAVPAAEQDKPEKTEEGSSVAETPEKPESAEPAESVTAAPSQGGELADAGKSGDGNAVNSEAENNEAEHAAGLTEEETPAPAEQAEGKEESAATEEAEPVEKMVNAAPAEQTAPVQEEASEESEASENPAEKKMTATEALEALSTLIQNSANHTQE